jgi:hypothetical protein
LKRKKIKPGKSSEINVSQVRKKHVAKKNIHNNIYSSSSKDEFDAKDLKDVVKLR